MTGLPAPAAAWAAGAGPGAGGPSVTGVALGGAFAVAGLVLLGLTVRRRARARRATRAAWGRVVRMDERRQVIVRPGEIESPVYTYPTVVFNDDQGRQHTIVARIGFDWDRYQVGQAVEVRYDPADPATAYIGTFDVAVVAGSVVGGLLTLVGLVVFLTEL